MKKMIHMFLALIMVLSLSACQPTPDKAAVASKTGYMEEKIRQPAVTEQQMLDTLPEKWQKEPEYFSRSGVTLVIDAKLEIPDVTAFPVVEAISREITIEEIESFIDVLMQGQPIYEHNNVATKSELEQVIIHMKMYIEELKKYSPPEEIKNANLEEAYEDLRYYEELYQNAPETKPIGKTLATVTFDTMPDGGKSLNIEADLGRDHPAYLGVYVSSYGDSHLAFRNQGEPKGYTIRLDDVYENLAQSRQEALETAVEYLRNLGFSGIQHSDTKVLATTFSDEGSVDPSVLINHPESDIRFEFYFDPLIYKIPVTPDIYFNGYADYTDDQLFNIKWGAESLTITVKGSEVIEMNWDSPGGLGEVLNENVELLDFEDIKERFESHLFYQRSWVDGRGYDTQISVKKVKLGMMRIKLKDSGYAYIPVWDFIGDYIYTSHDGMSSGYRGVSLMTINAIDGSVIDRYLGY